MDLAARHVRNVLVNANVTQLHHANSVATACQFLKNASLMSRGNVERRNLPQSPQSSDALDRRHGIWFDVFLDSVDIHERAHNANLYGPVLFVFDVDMLSAGNTGRLWVTKQNPVRWTRVGDRRYWFQDKDDLDENFVRGDFGQMILLRHCGGEVPFGGHLQRIIVDDPVGTWANNIDMYSMAVGALRSAMQEGGIDVPIRRRKCRAGCGCDDRWWQDQDRLRMMFHPVLDE